MFFQACNWYRGSWLRTQISNHSNRRTLRNVFPFALNRYPGCFRHFLNSFGLFFNWSSADATISALATSGSVPREKQVDLRWCEMTRTNLQSHEVSPPDPESLNNNRSFALRRSVEQRASSTLPRDRMTSSVFVPSFSYRRGPTAERLAICLERTVFLGPFLKQPRIVMKL